MVTFGPTQPLLPAGNVSVPATTGATSSRRIVWLALGPALPPIVEFTVTVVPASSMRWNVVSENVTVTGPAAVTACVMVAVRGLAPTGAAPVTTNVTLERVPPEYNVGSAVTPSVPPTHARPVGP